ncbi:MAG: lipoyl synthase [Elusimicrobiaceae bacterium]|jgi:lipoyl synthase|nr:lipoyl synthase [Elusimicrobiaceae bacterium]MBT3955378.1 lipoyl synthase [Elusimicrobiaceae bacterium]MBT4007655.1 lipoyl synthase [Elusimicrobiaceae bacterium]MBT4403182.1 lipoyl synthase [Elusimicrobiaceae bacterium]MBT4439568.1 lipoyl synthase [Elusimicrobiaceae bacterium]
MNVPLWLKKLVGENKANLRTVNSQKMDNYLNKHNLNTVCVEAKCPNRGECFKHGDATFMILGSICTRGCKFCAVDKSAKPLPPSANEPNKIAEAVKKWDIKYVVLTSPTRDDLADGGATHFASTIKAIKQSNPDTKIEPLIPDLLGDIEALKIILQAKPEVLAHNIETVPNLYKSVRNGANYHRSLKILAETKKISPKTITKSGIMLGLGEQDKELKQTIKDLAEIKCDLLTLGQYLAPSKDHNLVKNYPSPQDYKKWEKYALSVGIKAVLAGPLVRSSYLAGNLYNKVIKGMGR